MFAPAAARRWSRWAGVALAVCAVMATLASLADGLLYGFGSGAPWRLLFSDLRYLFGEGIFASAVLWIGTKFVETRTVLTVGFDRTDAASMRVRGPDDDNIVWIGRRYGSRAEAEAIALALESRMRQDG